MVLGEDQRLNRATQGISKCTCAGDSRAGENSHQTNKNTNEHDGFPSLCGIGNAYIREVSKIWRAKLSTRHFRLARPMVRAKC